MSQALVELVRCLMRRVTRPLHDAWLAYLTRRRLNDCLLLQVTVVEETIRYIDELHKALAAKLQSKTGLIMSQS